MENQAFPQSPLGTRKKSKKMLGIIIVALIVLSGLGAGGYKFLGTKNNIPQVTPTPTPVETFIPTETPFPTFSPTESPVPTKTLTPSPKPTINAIDKASGLDRAKLTIEVLNGSGVVGAGSKAANALRDLGYKISSTGNAENFDYENTVIQIKESKSNFLSLLKKDLAQSYTIDSSSSSLSASSSADAVVIVGKN